MQGPNSKIKRIIITVVSKTVHQWDPVMARHLEDKNSVQVAFGSDIAFNLLLEVVESQRDII